MSQRWVGDPLDPCGSGFQIQCKSPSLIHLDRRSQGRARLGPNTAKSSWDRALRAATCGAKTLFVYGCQLLGITCSCAMRLCWWGSWNAWSDWRRGPCEQTTWLDGHKRRVVQHFGLVVSQKPDLCRENLQIQCNPACSRKCLLSQTPTQEILKRKNPNSWITKHLFPLVSAWMGHALVTILPLKVLQDGQELKPLLQFRTTLELGRFMRLLMWPFLDFAHDRWIPKG